METTKMPHKFCYQNNLQLLLLLMRPQFGWHGIVAHNFHATEELHNATAVATTSHSRPSAGKSSKIGGVCAENRGGECLWVGAHVSFPINLLGQSIAGVGQT